MSMELIGYDVTFKPTGRHKITLDCIGDDRELETIRRAYYNGIYQLISLTGSNTDKKENKTMTATELNRIESEAYNRGYERGIKVGSNWGVSTHNDLKIKKVIFNDPATIVFWADGTKTVAKTHGDDKFNKEVGLTVCIAKKALGNRSNFDKIFKKWIK